jgi:predicted RNA-binding protein with PUA-like domain
MAGSPKTRARRYWLFKSEPEVYGWDRFVHDGRTHWHGVRNFQARNLLRDEIRIGDGVLFYHSNADPTAVVGVARVVKDGYPDASALDPKSPYHDADARADAPRWYMVDIEPVAPMRSPLTRDRLAAVPALAGMMLLRRGARLSVQPVTAPEWRAVLRLGGVQEEW